MATLAAACVGAFVPGLWFSREWSAAYDGRGFETVLANGLYAELDVDRGAFSTGSERFDGEWWIAMYSFAALGYGQQSLQHPESAPEAVARMEYCLDQALRPELRAFDTDPWGGDLFADLHGERGHMALGYVAIALSMHEWLVGESRFSDTETQLAEALRRRIEHDPTWVAETYPGDRFPVDNTASIGAIALHERAHGRDPQEWLDRWGAHFDDYVDPHTGLLWQQIHGDGTQRDRGRGSGTALAAYFLSFADAGRSASLYQAVESELYTSFLGFGTLREYPVGDEGRADIDSGPVLLGRGVSATGFGIGAARANEDRSAFTHLGATASMFGAPVDRGGERVFVGGGPLGDALMFAFATARPSATWAALR